MILGHRNSIIIKIIIVTIILSATLSSCLEGNSNNTYRNSDEEWIDKAIELHFGPGKNSRDRALMIVNPSIVYLPEMVCVGLNLKNNSLGADQTICFSKSDGSTIIVHNELQ